MESMKVKAYGASGSLIGGKTLHPMTVERHPVQEDELLIEVLFCGVCHSDVHQVDNDWKNTIYPCVPGHEVVGRVAEAGAKVSKFKKGDTVGVGCMIDSCGHCDPCREGEENLCEGPVSWTATYNGYMQPDGSGFNTFGGYSTHLVVKESFVLSIPESIEVSAAAPILCAGVTTYSPMKHWKVKPGDKVGIVGIGGLGHMAVMLAKALGAEVTAITTHEEKLDDAIALGAKTVLVSTDDKAMQEYELYFDFILVTIPTVFNVNPYVKLLKRRSSLVTVGLIGPYALPTDNQEVLMHCRSVGASLIGSIAETQEVLDFCAEHKIAPKVQVIPIQQINEVFRRVKDDKAHFRYVIDMASLKDEAPAGETTHS